MFTHQIILHPTDFSERSQYAFQLACSLARDYEARLIVLYVAQPTPVIFGEMVAVPQVPLDEELRPWRQKLHELQQTTAQTQVETNLRVGDPAEEVLREAEEMQADLIVMGTHGRTGLGRVLMGSVAEQVVRRATCPVLTIKLPAASRPMGHEDHHEIETLVSSH